MHVAGEALQHHEACSAALVELSLDIGEEQRRVIHSVAMTGKFQSIELSSHNMSTLRTVRQSVTGNVCFCRNSIQCTNPC